MSYSLVLLELWCLLFVCLMLGRRLVELLPNRLERTIGFYVAPILGLAFLVLLSTAYGWLSPFKWTISSVLTWSLVLISYLMDRRKHELVRQCLYIGLFALVCSLPIAAPIIRYGGYNPFTDIFTYIAQGQWLQQHSFAEKVITSGHYPSETQIALYQASGSRMGGTFFLGYVQSLLSLAWSYDAYIPTVCAAFVTGCLAIGGIIRQVIPVKKQVIFALALLPAVLSNGFIYGAEWGFYPQTLGLAFASGIGAFFPRLTLEILKHAKSWRVWRVVVYTLPLAICTAALLLAYNEPFPIFVGAIGLFFMVILLSLFYPAYSLTGQLKETLRGAKIKLLFSYAFIYLAEVLALVHYEAIRMVKNIYQTLAISNGGADIGWSVLWSPIQFIAFSFGMKSYFNNGHLSVDFLISTLVFPVVLVGLLYVIFQFMQQHPKRRATLIFLFCFQLLLLLFFCKFRYLSLSKSAEEIGHTFLQFKIAKYAAPFSMALLGIAAGICWHYCKAQRKPLAKIYCAVLLLGLYYHTIHVSRNFTYHFISSVQQAHDPFGVLLNLRKAISSLPKEDVIHVSLGADQVKLRQMVAYVLYDRKLSSDYRDDGYILGRLPPDDANMPLEQANKVLTMKQAQDLNDETHRLVGPFVILDKPFEFVIQEQPQGGYGTERSKQGDQLNFVQHTIDLPYRIVGHPRDVRMVFKLKSLHEARTFHIEIQTGKGLVLFNDTKPLLMDEIIYSTPWLALKENDRIILHVDADGNPARLSLIDRRKASFKLTNVTLFVK